MNTLWADIELLRTVTNRITRDSLYTLLSSVIHIVSFRNYLRGGSDTTDEETTRLSCMRATFPEIAL
jgi:hypothetical protein